MINSDAIDNFMTRALVKRKEYFTQKKSNAYNLVIVDENLLFNENEKMNKETKLLSITIQQHHEKLIFNIVKIITHDIILEMS
jgi:hypothetical protein